MFDIVMLSGSPTEPSRSRHPLRIASERLTARGHRVQCIDIRHLPAGALLHADWNDPAIQAALEAVQHAAAVLVATPLYKASYSGLFKAFLDLLPQAAFANKPVLPFATGGSLAHLLALDYALKPVLTALGARHVLDNVFATEADIARVDGEYRIAAPLAQRLHGAVESLMHVLDERAALTRLGTLAASERTEIAVNP
ncbi:TPA: NADPH-dependent FMN reductase [Burkholderia vietnamiensis]|uniref:NADPH-dependent FMN reductase n=1 Tax=Burkholderia vietnamiensis TaxID=60552 RepID=UPI001589E298|nr:NADPH-dependent FMN reductase [Burkholderia vietnamiensis]HDR9165469.1 NADPH-dependent FMN reductase [Burkholderia vietnamiensis]